MRFKIHFILLFLLVAYLKLITINLPQAYIDGIEKLVEEEIFPNRSEAIRIAVRDFCKKELTTSQMSHIFRMKRLEN